MTSSSDPNAQRGDRADDEARRRPPEEQLDKFIHEVIYNPGIRKLLDNKEKRLDVLTALERVGVHVRDREAAARALENLPYEELRRLAKSFGIKDDEEIN